MSQTLRSFKNLSEKFQIFFSSFDGLATSMATFHSPTTGKTFSAKLSKLKKDSKSSTFSLSTRKIAFWGRCVDLLSTLYRKFCFSNLFFVSLLFVLRKTKRVCEKSSSDSKKIFFEKNILVQRFDDNELFCFVKKLQKHQRLFVYLLSNFPIYTIK